jgi:hypothetical protein
MSGYPLLTENDRKERLSVAYAKALAAKVGYATSENDLDRDSVDIMLSDSGNDMRSMLGLQLKATSSPMWTDDGLTFVLSRKNYDDLRAKRMAPLILVVLVLPADEAKWLEWSTERLSISECAWWMSLKGYPDIDSKSKSIHIPRSQVFGPEKLKELMAQARGGLL